MTARTRIARLAADANARYVAGDYQPAAEAYRAALAIAETSSEVRPIELVFLLNGLGVVYKYLANFDAAEIVYRRALALAEQEQVDLSWVATLYHNLGGLEHARGRHAVGEPLARRSVEIREALHGPDHPDVAADLAALAALLDGQGKFDESEPIYRRVLGIFEQTHGPDHYEVGMNLANLAALKQAQGKLDEAEPLYQRALELKQRHLGPSHPSIGTTVHNMGALALLRRDCGRAAVLYQQALSILEPALGPDHPSVAGCRNGLARARAKAIV